MNLRRCILAMITILAPVQFAAAQQTVGDEKAIVARRDAFLRLNFTNFVAVKFVAPTNGTETVLQRFKVSEHLIGEFEGQYWSGIRFTVPTWMDGDYLWMFLHDYRPTDWQANYQWYIIPERGEMSGFTNFVRRYLTNSADLKAAFPNSTRAHVQRLARQEFKPGETYGIWWAHAQRAVADIVFGITIDSERGRKEFGSLPLTDAGAPVEDEGPEFFARAFIQQHFTNFSLVSFLPPTNKTETVIQRFNAFENEVGAFQSVPITGVRFTLPDWIDGDLQWMFFHINPEEQKRQRVNLTWGIASASSDSIPLFPVRIDPDDTLEFWQRFPTARRVYSHTTSRSRLKPGQSYVLYFGHFERDPPDIGFAITVDSERGRKEFGSLKFVMGRPGFAGRNPVSPRTAFIQENITGFPLVKFQPPTNTTDTVLQRLAVKDYLVGEFEGQHYTGIRFTVPEWIDGDLKWAFLNLYRENDLPRRFGISWNIAAERGEVRGIGTNTERIVFKDLPEMTERFPTTDKAYAGTIRRERLTPGRVYVFWWAYTQANVPDLLFALTIDSERGRKEFGSITWR